MSVQDDDSARGERQPPIDVPALLGRFREGYGIRQLSAWCGHGQGAIEDVLREALRGQAWQAIETAPLNEPVLVGGGGCPYVHENRLLDFRTAGRCWKGLGTAQQPTHWQPLPAPPADRETGAP